MEIAESIEALREIRNRWRDERLKVGFVPTMGNLHEGHLSLLHKARELCDKTICSIYVNPLQFDRAKDLENYPKTLDRDIEKLKTLSTDLLFVTDSLEGKHRKGHFTGVATVVCKLFNLVQPDVAVFGEKDFQQLLLIRQMTADLNFPIEIVGAPTKRTPEGLALSSRNGYLAEEELKQAPEIYRSLKDCVESLRAGACDFQKLESAGMQRLSATGFSPEYFKIRNTTDLKPARETENPDAWVVLVAAQLGTTRLIDNMQVAEPGKHVKS